MPDASPPSYEQLLGLVDRLSAQVVELRAVVAAQAGEIADLKRRLGDDSSSSSRPPSSDPPWAKQPAKPRSSRGRSGRKPGGQPGSGSSSRALVSDADAVHELAAPRCRGCAADLTGVPAYEVVRRQIVDLGTPPPPRVTEYRRSAKRCPGCGVVSVADWTAEEPGHAEIVAAPGSPVRIGPLTLARAALLTCAHYLPVSRSRELLEALCAMDVSTGFLAGVRGRAARKLEKTFFTHVQALLLGAPVLHADETPGRAAGALAWVHVACTEYLTLMHVGDRSAATIDAGQVLPAFTGVLVRDGYAGYAHLPAVHAWCAAHLLRDLRSLTDADPEGQLWADAMADTLTDAHRIAEAARARGAERIGDHELATIRNHYLGALARGDTDNKARPGPLATRARTLIGRFRRFEDMILRFTVDLQVPFTNNEAERAIRPVKIQQRTSGGGWRTLQGLIDFAVVRSYLDTATKWGITHLDALEQVFTTGPWLPPALAGLRPIPTGMFGSWFGWAGSGRRD